MVCLTLMSYINIIRFLENPGKISLPKSNKKHHGN